MAIAGNEINLKFDNVTGLLIKPDEQSLAKGLDADKRNRTDSALKHFTESAEYGNLVAMSMIGWHHLKNKEYIESMSWLQLIDGEKLPNKDHYNQMVEKLAAYLTAEEMQQVKERNNELMQTYGPVPTLLKRVDWKNNIRVTGSRNRGKIPLSTSYSLKGGIVIDGGNAKSQVDEFVYDYRFSDLDGRVVLGELEELDE